MNDKEYELPTKKLRYFSFLLIGLSILLIYLGIYLYCSHTMPLIATFIFIIIFLILIYLETLVTGKYHYDIIKVLDKIFEILISDINPNIGLFNNDRIISIGIPNKAIFIRKDKNNLNTKLEFYKEISKNYSYNDCSYFDKGILSIIHLVFIAMLTVSLLIGLVQNNQYIKTKVVETKQSTLIGMDTNTQGESSSSFFLLYGESSSKEITYIQYMEEDKDGIITISKKPIEDCSFKIISNDKERYYSKRYNKEYFSNPNNDKNVLKPIVGLDTLDRYIFHIHKEDLALLDSYNITYN